MISVIIIPIYAVYISVADLGSFDYQNTIAQFLSPVIFGAIWEAILRMGLGKEKKYSEKSSDEQYLFCYSKYSDISHFFTNNI